MTIKDNVTLVSGYWPIHSKHSVQAYHTWFHNTLKINQRMIFFCDKETIPLIKSYRGDLETIFVEYKIKDFYCTPFYNPFWIDRCEIPSSELGKIWHEKLHMLKLAKDMDGANATDFYVWYDAANCVFRNETPPTKRLNLENPKHLPCDKISYSESYPPEEDHKVSGTVLIVPRELIDDAHTIFYNVVRECTNNMNDWKNGSDQVILSEMLKRYPRIFYKVSDGYGENIRKIYEL